MEFKENDIIAQIGFSTKYLVYSWYPTTTWCELVPDDVHNEPIPIVRDKILVENDYVLLEREDGDEC